MVGEEVGVARCCVEVLLPPSSVTQVEDEDGERENEDDFGADKSREYENSSLGVKAAVEQKIVGGVGGAEWHIRLVGWPEVGQTLQILTIMLQHNNFLKCLFFKNLINIFFGTLFVVDTNCL